MDVNILKGEFEINENPDLTTTDPRLSHIVTLVQKGDFRCPVLQSKNILDEKIYDIRNIGYYLYGHFAESGLAAAEEIFTCLAEILHKNIAALVPARNREKHIKNTLSWLFKTISNNLIYETEKRTQIYSKWQASITPEQVQSILESGWRLQEAITLLEASSDITDLLTKILEWFQVFQNHEQSWGDEEEQEVEVAEEASLQQETKKQLKDDFNIEGIEGSYHIKLLMRKLDAFDSLVEADKLALAAIVADDINNTISNFDPKLYFPGLFTRFYVQFAKNLNQLINYVQFKNSAAWATLQELYKVDIESFISFDAGDIFFKECPDIPSGQAPGELIT
ncbi:MAG: type VI secretion system protein IglI family protein [Smithellaceae bacterium]